MIAIIRWGLWQRRWQIFWWSVSLVALIALIILIYPTFQGQADQLDRSLGNIPQSAKALITDTSDIFSPEGYLSSQLFYLTLPLILSILSIGLGSSLVNREEQNGTLELLLSRPISRSELLLGKAFVGLLVLAAVCAVSVVTTIICSKAVHIGVPLERLAGACLLATLLSVVFGAVAFTLSALGRASRLMSVGVASLIAFASYLLSSLAGTVHWLEWPAKVLPFHYYQPANVMNGIYHWWYTAAFGGVIIVLFLLALIGFRRRDIGG